MTAASPSAASPRPAIAPRQAPKPSRRIVVWIVLIATLALGAVGLWLVLDNYLRAASVLARLSNPDAKGFITRFSRRPFVEETGSAETPHGLLTFRLYVPKGLAHPPGIVVLDGIHRAGIEEPRLINFARALCGAGIEVMTPQLQDLADYRVTPATIDTIGDSAVLLGAKMGQPKVGILGLSFGGGLALLAAAQPEFSDKIGFVVAVGAHDDMIRVARFFAANMIEKPDGSTQTLRAHEYGALILAYSHPEDFFSPKDVPVATDALQKWIWEQPHDSMKIAETLSPAGKQELDLLLHHRSDLEQAFLREVEHHQAEMQAVSPHSHLNQLRVPVFLLHGATDTVIPPSETLWLAKDVPPGELREVLVSSAMNMIHVDGEHPVTLSEKSRLVNFFAGVLKAAGKMAAKNSR
jgi:pimeloyl-ACP methyl ester carboxylesterase